MNGDKRDPNVVNVDVTGLENAGEDREIAGLGQGMKEAVVESSPEADEERRADNEIEGELLQGEADEISPGIAAARAVEDVGVEDGEDEREHDAGGEGDQGCGVEKDGGPECRATPRRTLIADSVKITPEGGEEADCGDAVDAGADPCDDFDAQGVNGPEKGADEGRDDNRGRRSA